MKANLPEQPAAALPDISSPPASNEVGVDGSPSTDRIQYEKVDWRPEYDERLQKWRHENKAASAKAAKKRAEYEELRKNEAIEAKALAAKNGPPKPAPALKVGGVAETQKEDVVPAVNKVGEDEQKWKKVGEAWKTADSPALVATSSSATQSGEPSTSSSKSVTIAPTPKETSSSSAASKKSDLAPSAPADLPIEAYLTGSSSLNPPSLTLALFSSKYLPPRRRILLGLACIGVNVLLPFIGGMSASLLSFSPVALVRTLLTSLPLPVAGFGELAAKGIQNLVRETFFLPRSSFATSGVGLAGTRKNETAVHAAERTAVEANPLRSAFP